MSRAERRRAIRDARKGKVQNDQTIRLTNPVNQHFPVFISGNATCCQRIPRHESLNECNADCRVMVEAGSAQGQRLVLCGAGPSLRDCIADYAPKGDQVWGCNSAAPWMYEQGHKVTHAFTVDQTPAMCVEWESLPPVEYLIASTVHPFLVDMLTKAGRPTRLFHNYVGIAMPPVDMGPAPDGSKRRMLMEYEHWLYRTLYPETAFACSGLNSVNRALDVAAYMGFERVDILGADCALRVMKAPPKGMVPGSPQHVEWLENHVEMHADGGHALASGATPMTLVGEIDGREWHSKPDMMISATFLVKQVRALRNNGMTVTLVGDTLPNALMDKDDTFLTQLPTLIDHNGKPILPP